MDREYALITLRGVVQGVGMRPAVYRLGRDCGVVGDVRNNSGAVMIRCAGNRARIDVFIDKLKTLRLPFAQIDSMEIQTIPTFQAEGFSVAESGETDAGTRFVPPDLKLCAACAAEIDDPKNRRYDHAFASCVSCGPRFSIMERFPYDRAHTSMRTFPLCALCGKEYRNPTDRRFHAQTNCCPDCGPALRFLTRDDDISNDPLDEAVAALRQGKILAVKGIGGYHLSCSPFFESAVATLRNLKGRDRKPFAVMFRDIEAVRAVCNLSEGEEALLTSNPAPITLLRLRGTPFAEAVLCGDLWCGCFLPYTPLHHLLLRDTESLVMTSANRSGSPIFTDDASMLAFFDEQKELDGVLFHNRPIVRRVEDSVARVIPEAGLQIVRRGRGYVPMPLPLHTAGGDSFLAMGGDLKASFCLVKDGQAILSPYGGDLEDEDAFHAYTTAVTDFLNVFHARPEFTVCDSHPLYRSAQYAKQLGLPCMAVQHHHAHIASVMAEHGLTGDVLGVAFDGTGYGDDGTVWGGEFLLCRGGDYDRVGHLESIPLLGGDAAARDADRTAACFLCHAGLSADDRSQDVIRAALAHKVNTALSSSMGRLFDAVAALLNLSHVNGYEGECAIRLERCAQLAQENGIAPVPLSFALWEDNGVMIASTDEIISTMHNNTNHDVGALALGFHWAVADMVRAVCRYVRERVNIHQVALSGGVFQNQLLLRRCLVLLRQDGFAVAIHHAVPPGDGGIALGQAYIAAKRKMGEGSACV